MSTPNINERAPPTGSQIRAMAFSASGEYLVSADKEAVRVWRVADNQQVGSTRAKDVRSLAVSRDGRWIAAGKSWGEMAVWERPSLKEHFATDEGHTVTSVDFSPDSTRLVVASGSCAACVWDVAARRVVVGPLQHSRSYWIVAAKFSPHGDRIATATFLRDTVRLYDSRDGSLLASIAAKVSPYYNTGLLWSNGSIFVLANDTVRQISTSTSTVVGEWAVQDGNYPCILSPRPDEFILHSAGCTVTLCNTLEGTQHVLVELAQDAHSIALSPDSRFLAVGGGDGTIAMQSLSPHHLEGQRRDEHQATALS